MNKFRRVEEKYILSESEYKKLLKKISKYLIDDIYPKYTICSVYFDSDNYDSIIKSIEKPIYKEKVRIRSYGVIDNDGYLYLELKKKYKGIVSKRRIKMNNHEFNKFMDNKLEINNQILKEISYVIIRDKLKPKIFIAYDRLSYVGIDNTDLRITFDSNLRSRDYDLVLNKNDLGVLYFDKSTYIMEVKTLGSIPLWLSKVLSELSIYPRSFSKYGEIYKRRKLNV